MAGSGRELTEEVLDKAIQEFCSQNKGIMASEGEQDGRKRWLLSPGDIVVQIKDGKLDCPTHGVKMDLSRIIMNIWESEPGSEPTKVPNLAKRKEVGITSRSQAGSVPGSALDTLKQCAQAIEPTYQVAGREAPTAKTILTAAADIGISFEVLRYIHKPDYIEAHVKAIILHGPMHSEAVVSIYKQDFINSRAWEMVGKQARFDNNILDPEVPFSENGMPSIRKDAMVQVKVGGGKDSIKSGYQKFNAQLWLYQELMQAWIFMGRQCVTKAKAKAASELLLGANPNQEIQEEGELADEMKEREMVEGMQ